MRKASSRVRRRPGRPTYVAAEIGKWGELVKRLELKPE
ncbi:hypothetical protein L508_2765 [Bordetella bronchiseptica M435/02/3]|nr:hypothetical protein L508_2765 [Bordetella bronchiseptica M435/02/3]